MALEALHRHVVPRFCLGKIERLAEDRGGGIKKKPPEQRLGGGIAAAPERNCRLVCASLFAKVQLRATCTLGVAR